MNLNLNIRPVYGLFDPEGRMIEEGYSGEPRVGYGVLVEGLNPAPVLPELPVSDEITQIDETAITRLALTAYYSTCYSQRELFGALVGCKLSNGWSSEFTVGCDFETPDGVRGGLIWQAIYRGDRWPAQMRTQSLKVTEAGRDSLVFEGIPVAHYFNRLAGGPNCIIIYEPEPFTLLKPHS